MKFVKGQSYKIIEFDKVLTIVDARTPEPGIGSALVIADMPSLVIYLTKYITVREEGGSLSEAHNFAVEDASTVEVKAMQ